MELTGRLFLCVRCRTHVLVCRDCDRGQIYCSKSCSGAARGASVRAAGQRYQASWRGRMAHAERSRRYRTRHQEVPHQVVLTLSPDAQQQNVTHQGSLTPEPDDLLASNSAVRIAQPHPCLNPETWSCCFCGCRCPALVRSGFVHGRRVPHTNRRGTEGGYSP